MTAPEQVARDQGRHLANGDAPVRPGSRNAKIAIGVAIAIVLVFVVMLATDNGDSNNPVPDALPSEAT